jgi:hypothetical protein
MGMIPSTSVYEPNIAKTSMDIPVTLNVMNFLITFIRVLGSVWDYSTLQNWAQLYQLHYEVA